MVRRALPSSTDTYILVHVDVATASTTNADANMVFGQVLASQLAASLIEGSRKHQVTMISILIGIFLVSKADKVGRSSYLRQT